MGKQIAEEKIETIPLRIVTASSKVEFLIKKSSVVDYCRKLGVFWWDLTDEEKEEAPHAIASNGPSCYVGRINALPYRTFAVI